ncbi:MAG: GTPase domain-containing protein [Promethearchaeia archaeon]
MLIKLLYWGMVSSGKTTAVDTLYNLTKEEEGKDMFPVSDLTKISMKSGATLYFDRGVFQSHKLDKLKFHIYTVAGQKQFSPLRHRVFKGTEGVIYMVDSQVQKFEDNIEALLELKRVSKGRLIKEIPLVVMLNKQDLDDVIEKRNIRHILKEEGLWYEPDDPLATWNPPIYETCALFDKRKNIYRSFSDLARRTYLYKTYGEGKAPTKKPKKPIIE